MAQRSNASSDSPGGPMDEARMDGLDDVVRSRLSGRDRLMRAGLLVALVLTVAAGLVWRSTSAGAPTSRTDTSPNDSMRLASVLVVSNVNYGVVTVNGQKQNGSLPVIIHLRSGKNAVTFDASPFASVPCIIIWPEATTSANAPECSLAAMSPSENVVVRGKVMAVGGELTFSIGGASLPPAECARALDALASSLDALALTTVVPVGQHIATGHTSQEGVPVNQSAPAGLSARLTLRVDDGSVRRCDRLFASGPQLSAQDVARPARTWALVAPVTEALSFVGLDSTRLAPSASTEGTIQVNLVVPSNSRFDWQLAAVTPPLSTQIAENLCGGGSQVLAAVYHLAYPNVSGYNFVDRGAHGIEGCLLELDASVDNWGTRGTYLWRFGVLMATDAASHKLLPMLPLASAAELATVPKES